MESKLQTFELRLRQEKIELRRKTIETVQINLGRLCNQACLHCHVEAGPNRTEVMDRQTVELAIEFVAASGAMTADLTGGAPELNPSFRYLVDGLTAIGKRVLVRSNLTVLLEPGMQEIPEYFAAKQVEVIASLPCYTQENVDSQRGSGVYRKSIAVLRQLNGLGYGRDGSGLVLNLAYNPNGVELPGEQEGLEADYKRELLERFGLVFNHLYTITNQPIGRFSRLLRKNGEEDQYAKVLAGAFNPATLSQLMCLRQVSISWDGFIFDCDFNQMLNLCLGNGHAYRLGEIPADELTHRLQGSAIKTGPHCFACTAGAGSSCGGALA
jgi:radical SAM/Cys-rich protein